MRIPFLDSQTKVAQANNCMLWLTEYQRHDCLSTTPPSTTSTTSTSISGDASNGRVYSYPIKKWYNKHRRLDPSQLIRHYHPNHHHHHLYNIHHHHHHHHHLNGNHHHHSGSSANLAATAAAASDSNHFIAANENSNSMDATNLVANASVGTNGNGGDKGIGTIKEESNSGGGGGEPMLIDHHRHSAAAVNYIDDSFDNYEAFNDPGAEPDTDHDDYEESGKKKKKKVNGRLILFKIRLEN